MNTTLWLRSLTFSALALSAVACGEAEQTPDTPREAVESAETLDQAWPGRDPKTDATCHQRAAWCPARDLAPWSSLTEQAVSIRFNIGDVDPKSVVTSEETETTATDGAVEINTRVRTTAEASSFGLIKEFAPYYVEVEGPGVLEVEIIPEQADDEASWLILTPEMEKFGRFDGLKAQVTTEKGGLIKVAVLPESAHAEMHGGELVATLKYEIEARWYPQSPDETGRSDEGSRVE
ncbi:MAG: hypothetical protein ACE366_29975 [Bradymonadia bacterium]